MRPEDHQPLQELLGAYVLGQLNDWERARVQQHLDTCPECRAEVAALAPVVAALDRLDPAGSPQAVPPPELGEQVLAQVRRRAAAARRSRWRQAAASALVAASVATAFAVGGWWSGPRNDPPVIAVNLELDQAGLTADAGLVRHTWGTELKLEATGLAQGQSYAVTFLRDDGSRVSAGSFIGTGTNPLRCSVNAALPVEAAAQVEITDAQGQVVMDADLR